MQRPTGRPGGGDRRFEAAVQQLIHDEHRTLGRGSRLPACISNAGLAFLLRGLIEPETFEMLAGPWLEVMHH